MKVLPAMPWRTFFIQASQVFDVASLAILFSVSSIYQNNRPPRWGLMKRGITILQTGRSSGAITVIKSNPVGVTCL